MCSSKTLRFSATPTCTLPESPRASRARGAAASEEGKNFGSSALAERSFDDRLFQIAQCMASEKAGSESTRDWMSVEGSTQRVVWPTVRASTERGAWSRKEVSPNISPGPRRATSKRP